ncbi:39S ribosomal protein L54, mitochondrial [Arapaima gigas]
MAAYSLYGAARSFRPFSTSIYFDHVVKLFSFRIQTRGYAAKKVAAKGKSKGMMKEVLKGPEVCKDPVKLTSYAVGVNIFKHGEDPLLQPHEEYPDWLFQLNLGPAKKLSELDPESYEYLKRLRKEHIWRSNKLQKGQRF